MESAILAQIPSSVSLSPSSSEAISAIERATDQLLQHPQLDLVTEHVLHGGMYTRTIRLPKMYAMTGAFINIPTILVLHGFGEVLTNDGWKEFNGYHVLAGSAGRQQAFKCWSEVEMTMIFPSQAKTVEEAEKEFTDDYEKLMSRHSANDILLVTGE